MKELRLIQSKDDGKFFHNYGIKKRIAPVSRSLISSSLEVLQV